MPMQNKIISGYTIRYLLGEGGMSEVWYAENSIGKTAAVKVLKEEFLNIQQVVDRFKQEAHVMVKLQHPNICQVYDYGKIDERPCIVMEYLKGRDLSSRMKQGTRFEREQLQQWWNQLIDALNYTHQQHIVHRDIKPSNIFLTDNKEIKLLDFGIARIRDSITVTATGIHLGTLLYMSPEQVKDSKSLDYRSDIYSLAVTFWHLLTGVAPYDTNSSDFEILTKIVHEPLRLDNIPADWAKFLEPYLDKNPIKRPELRKFEFQPPPKQPLKEDTKEFPKEDTKEFPKGKPPKVPLKPPIIHKSRLMGITGIVLAILIGVMVFNLGKISDFFQQLLFSVDITENIKSSATLSQIENVKLRTITGGAFTMGSPKDEPDRKSAETQHSVTLSDFRLSEKAITNEQYCIFLNAMGISGNGKYKSGLRSQKLIEPHAWGVQYKKGKWLPASGKAKFPVVNVNWFGAKAYCYWAGGRLPTEAEWEYACRAGANTPFNTGNNLTTSQANYDGRSPYNKNPKGKYVRSTQSAGSYTSNNWGLYDMHGNVWEWCSDWYGDYETGTVTNPTGPTSGWTRVLRGGSWQSPAKNCRSACRSNYGSNRIENHCGFRLAASP